MQFVPVGVLPQLVSNASAQYCGNKSGGNIFHNLSYYNFSLFSLTYGSIEHSLGQPNIGNFGTKYYLVSSI